MKGIRQAVTCLCLAAMLFVPSLAVSGEICRGDEAGNATLVQPESKLNLAQLRATQGWSAEAMASYQPSGSVVADSQTADPQAAQTQTSHKKWSTAKKTWVIVGSVVGAALIIAAVSNSGGGGGGGGGY